MLRLILLGMVELTNTIKEIIHFADLFLLDIKHINPQKCKQLVGFSNEKEIAFARYLSNIRKPMWIRQVIIPGITNNKDDLEQLKEFINTLATVEKVELLKYHDMGKFKWKNLGYAYELENVPLATEEDIEKAKAI